jgi:hypothetical protein
MDQTSIEPEGLPSVHLPSVDLRHSRSPHLVHRENTSRTSRDKHTSTGINARSTDDELLLLWLQSIGGHGAIKNKVVVLRVGMIVAGLLGGVKRCC